MLRLVVEQEQAFNSIRQPTERHALNEMIIAENGPLLHQADIILEKAMNTRIFFYKKLVYKKRQSNWSLNLRNQPSKFSSAKKH